MDILYTADQQGVPANDSAVRSLMQQDRNEMMASDQAVLGDSGLRQLKQYNRALPVAWVVNQVAMDVALTPTPLSGAQADQLGQILANASATYQGGGAANAATVNWPAALGQAQGILTPTQFAALQAQYYQSQLNPLVAQFRNQEKAAR